MQASPPQRPTLQQVADRAGVSRATVSRVVNSTGSVDAALVERVRTAVAELHYIPNAAARSLMTRRTDTVALLAAESESRVFGDPFFGAIVRGVSQELGRAGLHLLVSMSSTDADAARVEAFLRGGHVDGALVISEHDQVDLVGRAARTAVPVVVGGRPLTEQPGVTHVDHDNRGGGALAAERLLTTGRRRIGTIAGPQDMSAGIDRLEGFRTALGPAYDAALVEPGDFTVAGGAAAAERLLARCPEVDGLFVANDLMALGALDALRRGGRSVPGDVAVVGFDDTDAAATADPPLTTVRQRSIAQGRLMAQVLLRRLGRGVAEPLPELAAAGTADDGLVLGVELVVRASA